MKKYFIKDGNLSGIGAVFCLLFGFLCLFLTFKFSSSQFVAILGFLISFFFLLLAGYTGRAKALGLKPFTKDPKGWRKARKTYKDKAEQTTTTDAHSSKPVNEDEPPLKN